MKSPFRRIDVKDAHTVRSNLYTVPLDDITERYRVLSQQEWVSRLIKHAQANEHGVAVIESDRTIMGFGGKRYLGGVASLLVDAGEEINVHIPIKAGFHDTSTVVGVIIDRSTLTEERQQMDAEELALELVPEVARRVLSESTRQSFITSQ